MPGIVYDWWMSGSEAERHAIAQLGLHTLETLLRTQFVPEPQDIKKQILLDLARMSLSDLKKFPDFSYDYMTKVYKAGLMNDTPQKIAFLSKLPANLGDMVLKDIEQSGKIIEQIYWVDLIFRIEEKIKYLCWQKTVHNLSPSQAVCKEVLPWTKFRKSRKGPRRSKRYGKYKIKRVANPRKHFS